MTPKQQRIAIAEACPFVEKHGKGELLWRVCGRLVYFDPLNDLNACAKFETETKWGRDGNPSWQTYVTTLEEVCYHHILAICATAPQRSEAFCRTMFPEKFTS